MLYFLEFHFLKIDLNRLAYSSTSKLFVELSIYKCIYRYIYTQLHIHTQNTAQHITLMIFVPPSCLKVSWFGK